jgi:acyl dehydratase
MIPGQVQVGDELPPYVIDAVDPNKMKIMAAILRDPNPIHFDVSSVQALGLGDRVVNQGPATLSYIADLIAQWAGGTAAIRSLDVRLQGNVFAGDRVECRGRVSAVDASSGIVELQVRALVDDREVIVGTATVGPPR